MSQKSIIQKIIQFPIVRIVIALIFVAGAVQGVQFIMNTLGDNLFKSSEVPKQWNVLIWSLSIFATWLGYLMYVKFVEKRSLSELSKVGAIGELMRGIFVGSVLFVCVMLILYIFGYYNLIRVNGIIFIIIPFFHYAYTAVYEEIVFRGIFFRVIEEKLGSWIAVLISGLFFGFAHNATVYTNITIAVLGGLLFAAAYIYTRRLWLAIGIHFAWNFIQVGIFGLALSEKDGKGMLESEINGSDFLSGGIYGIETSIVTFILVLLTSFYLLWKGWKKGNIIQPFWMNN